MQFEHTSEMEIVCNIVKKKKKTLKNPTATLSQPFSFWLDF